LGLIGAVAPAKDSRVVDVGGGASRLVDCLLDEGYSDVTMVDVSEAALDVARTRLADRGEKVAWLVGDVRHLRLPQQVDVWHDRAVFHFLTEEADRQAYLDAVRGALRVGGHVVMATFGPGGPDRCSGLPVERYDAAKLSESFGSEFELVRSFQQQHVTPAGAVQEFTYAVLRRLG
jgi:ubiquinone/menaquinone biosynthesis C-methylase UbiE